IYLTLFFLVLERVLRRKNILRYFPILLFVSGVIYFCYQYQVLQYFMHLHKPDKDYFLLNYTDASRLHFKVKHPKSLILIYVESLEASYANPAIFGRDLLKELGNLQKNNLHFSKFQQVSGTGWTAGGLIATQCALPLKSLTIMGNNRI